MKIAVSYDVDGTILTMFNPDAVQHAKGTLKYVPGKGERHHVIEVPKEFESKPFMELPKLLRVNAKGAHPKLESKV